MSNWLRLKRRASAPLQRLNDEVIVYADGDGALHTVDEEGTVGDVGGNGGSQPVPFVGNDPPNDPTDGELWWDTDDDTPLDGGPVIASGPIPVSAADFLSLHVSSVEIVAGQPGIAWVTLAARMVFTHGTAYSGGGEFRIGPDLQLSDWGFPDLWVPDAPAQAMLQGSTDRWVNFQGTNGGDAPTLADAFERPLVLDMTAQATDGTGTGVLTVFYAGITI